MGRAGRDRYVRRHQHRADRHVRPRIARYVRLTALTEAGNRGPWSSAAEINVLGRAEPDAGPRPAGRRPRTSQETAAGNCAAANVLDGNAGTIWHTQWSTAGPTPLPHTLTVDTADRHEPWAV